ncbi:prolyl oligopeptidase family serine peptidase [Ideonella livida]|uniref:S9 family peptidase n=1 Tax=Ideonella livida TaxID=2707176 RepID=A0A7C9PE72_9BURK|nr:prolyl oligopeptidase family serine peptidase [Ideonella livida]NDY89573.1 S9 family peptidase [Ideonella livida]
MPPRQPHLRHGASAGCPSAPLFTRRHWLGATAALGLGGAAGAAGSTEAVPAPAPAASAPSPLPPAWPQTPDPWQWLETVEAPQALDWVRGQNARTEAALAQPPAHGPTLGALQAEFLDILHDRQRIPAVQRSGDHVYNLWQDAEHPRGLWRRTRVEDYERPEPRWEPLLDLDRLGREDGTGWVWKGAALRGSRALVSLSRGGADALVVREFDLARRDFVPDGFRLPEAKGGLEWLDDDQVLVSTDFGPGTLTTSGYPRQVRLWRRGQPLDQARLLHEAAVDHVAISSRVQRAAHRPVVLLTVHTDFFHARSALWWPDQPQRPPLALDLPDHAEPQLWGEWLLLETRKPWRTGGRDWPAGVLLATPLAGWLQAGPDTAAPAWQAVFEPSARRFLGDWVATASRLVLQVQDDVAHRLEVARPVPRGAWPLQRLPLPHPGSLRVQALRDPQLPMARDRLAEQLLVEYVDFLTPNQQLRIGSDGRGRRTLRSRRKFFDAQGLQAEQAFARSADGTQVPYFLVGPRDGRPRPTLLYGYGGFQVSQDPFYSAVRGRAWLTQGGRFVLANIRGGGEYGPAWHQAALKTRRQRAFDDFIAVAEDLVRRGLTTPRQLGIQGGSNGGLLVGAVMTQRPELFNAVICEVPLLDMQRYHLLLAGASWVGEYGHPDDPEEGAALRRYSPYHQLRAGVAYPPLLLLTSTRDDRVHPGHARKMAAQLQALGQPAWLHERLEGGHAGSADPAQLAHQLALSYSFLWRHLGGPPGPR